MPEIICNNGRFEYEIIKKKKKNIGIAITKDGKVLVTTPFFVEDYYIQEVMNKRSAWVISKIKLMKERNKELVEMKYLKGDMLTFLGHNYPLEVVERNIKNGKVDFDGRLIRVIISQSMDEEKRLREIKITLTKWYREEALNTFKDRTSYYSNILGLFPNNLRIKEQRTLWGSCSSKNNINYNWKLIMAPLDILDYIVVHELCHLKHRNHSKDFWDLVERIMPDYKIKRKWLRENGNRLMSEL
jgi:predicted metal-dependent hydrolase